MTRIPHDTDSERAYLGSLFRIADRAELASVLSAVSAGDFFVTLHRAIYRSCVIVAKSGALVDAVAVSNAMGDRMNGAAATIADMMIAAPSSANARHYARSVCEASIRRRALLLADDLRRGAADQGRYVGEPVDEALRRCRLLAGQVADLDGRDGLVSSGDDTLADIERALQLQESGERVTLPLPWPRLSSGSKALRPGTICVLAGPPGVGKSFFVATIAKHCHDSGVSWKYLPLEDTKTDFKWRLMALLEGSYVAIDDDQKTAYLRREMLERHGAALQDLASHVCENPRAGKIGPDGKVKVPAVPHRAILDWLDENLETHRVVFLDPTTQIEFDGRKTWEAEKDFVRQVLGMTANSGATLVVVAHPSLRKGKASQQDLGLDDLQGSAAWTQLCHSVLFVERHREPKTSRVHRSGGKTEPVQHNRTVTIAKGRNADGQDQRVAFEQSTTAPWFFERGVIAPKGEDE